jgi:hypothetical protein
MMANRKAYQEQIMARMDANQEEADGNLREKKRRNPLHPV